MSDMIALDEKLDLGAAAALTETLTARLGAPVALDGSRVRGLGGLCAQVLLAAARRWRTDGQAFALHPSEPMMADLRRLGLAQEILHQDSPS